MNITMNPLTEKAITKMPVDTTVWELLRDPSNPYYAELRTESRQVATFVSVLPCVEAFMALDAWRADRPPTEFSVSLVIDGLSDEEIAERMSEMESLLKKAFPQSPAVAPVDWETEYRKLRELVCDYDDILEEATVSFETAGGRRDYELKHDALLEAIYSDIMLGVMR